MAPSINPTMTNVPTSIVAGQPIHHRDTSILHPIFMRFPYSIEKNKNGFGSMKRWSTNLPHKTPLDISVERGEHFKAEDALQDVFLKAWRARWTFDPAARPARGVL
ncbi:MAG TPA: hypothetical protein ENH11_03385 [Candidatus Acetothermia bacterium]|nr:hypothetical protein [Candidatus Acetothermia bacterium]